MFWSWWCSWDNITALIIYLVTVYSLPSVQRSGGSATVNILINGFLIEPDFAAQKHQATKIPPRPHNLIFFSPTRQGHSTT